MEKVIAPSVLVREAADVIGPFWQQVVVVGAAALQIVLAESIGGNVHVAATSDLDLVIVTPTRDVDLAVETEQAEGVIVALEDAGLSQSAETHEQGFTWVRGDLKIQLMRPFHPFPAARVAPLPINTVASELREEVHRDVVAFADDPGVPRLQSVSAAALVALKEAAFGRIRPDNQPVERDYHDVYLVVRDKPDDLERSYRPASFHVRSRVDRALATLADGGEATQAAARQETLITGRGNARETAENVRRTAVFFQRRLAAARP